MRSLRESLVAVGSWVVKYRREIMIDSRIVTLVMSVMLGRVVACMGLLYGFMVELQI